MKKRLKQFIAFLLAAALLFAPLILNSSAAEAYDVIKWQNGGDFVSYTDLKVVGDVPLGKSTVDNKENTCYRLTASETGYYLIECADQMGFLCNNGFER